MDKMISWLNVQSEDVVTNSYDKFMISLYRINYLTLRIILGIILGREKRNRSSFFQRLHKGNYINPSFLTKIYLYSFLKRFGINKTISEIYISKYDHKIFCPLNEIDYLSLVSREEDILKKFTPDIGDIVIDIGAHIGRYTIIGSKKVTDKGRVISIEANPNVFDLLIKNIRLNQLENVLPLNYAVYSEKTKIKLFVTEGKGLENNHYGTIVQEIDNFSKKGFDKYIEVTSNTIDSILLENNVKEEDVKWLKIDVEGAEFEVIKGAKNLLSKAKNLSIMMEIHNLSNGNNYYKQIKEFLSFYKFTVEYEKHHESGEIHVIFKN